MTYSYNKSHCSDEIGSIYGQASWKAASEYDPEMISLL